MSSRRKTDDAQMAQSIEGTLRDIRAHMNRRLEAAYASGTLTAPQTSVMQAIYHSQGMTLKELCNRVRLAHSTVSGIVDRLQARGMLERKPAKDDRRYTLITVTAAVRDWMGAEAPRLAAAPLLSALHRATQDDKKAIVLGLQTLLRLLERARADSEDATH